MLTPQKSHSHPRRTQMMRKFMMVMLLTAVAAAPAAYASPGFDFGANIARTTTSGYGNSSDFGLTAGYDFNRSMGVEGGYESLMGYEMTLLTQVPQFA
ncbi:outer membrane beta-barrel protein, partial [Metallibacterium scheffleri]|uniref:outer membrane beta-barrel protein n=1 Tax=Metallibacterium scheffleri TaxID=993689 RepID=UPI001447C592